MMFALPPTRYNILGADMKKDQKLFVTKYAGPTFASARYNISSLCRSRSILGGRCRLEKRPIHFCRLVSQVPPRPTPRVNISSVYRTRSILDGRHEKKPTVVCEQVSQVRTFASSQIQHNLFIQQ